MKTPFQFVLLLVVVALVAMGACLLTRYFVPIMRHDDPESAHDWVHRQLGITPEQTKLLDPIEHRYDERRRALDRTIRQANAELATAILEDQAASPKVNATIEKIHAAQGELQMVTISHVFEMKTVLTPGQYEKLLKLTAEALKSEPSESH
ncbi:hypothetical protein BH09VER1_BH09VER1_12060 [soil metagenome]